MKLFVFSSLNYLKKSQSKSRGVFAPNSLNTDSCSVVLHLLHLHDNWNFKQNKYGCKIGNAQLSIGKRLAADWLAPHTQHVDLPEPTQVGFRENRIKPEKRGRKYSIFHIRVSLFSFLCLCHRPHFVLISLHLDVHFWWCTLMCEKWGAYNSRFKVWSITTGHYSWNKSNLAQLQPESHGYLFLSGLFVHVVMTVFVFSSQNFLNTCTCSAVIMPPPVLHISRTICQCPLVTCLVFSKLMFKLRFSLFLGLISWLQGTLAHVGCCSSWHFVLVWFIWHL